MIKAFIFDMDGVLVNSEKLKAQAWKKALSEYGISDGDIWYTKNLGNSRDALSAKAIKEFSLTSAQIDEISEKKRVSYMAMLKMTTEPISSTVSFLKSIPKNKFKIAVNSSIDTWVIEHQMEKIGVKHLLDVYTSGKNEVVHDKPAPDIYVLTAKKLGVRPDECIVIEDSTAGVSAAKSAGMKCVGFKSIHSGNQDLSKADMISEDLSKTNAEKIVQLLTS